MELQIRADINGAPDTDNVIAEANVTSYNEVATGEIYFEREAVESSVEFDPIKLDGGRTYWFEATIAGTENNFWLTTGDGVGNCWVNYEDFVGYEPGFDRFGADTDLNFRIGGKENIPEPVAICVLAAAGLALLRRSR